MSNELQPPQVFGYASPEGRQKGAAFLASIGWYCLGQFIVGMAAMMRLVGIRNTTGLAFRFAVFSVVDLVIVNFVGFILAFITIRPAAHPKRWPPYVLVAIAGAATVPCGWLVVWGIESLRIIDFDWKWLTVFGFGLIVTSFFASTLLLLLYRFTVDRNRRTKVS